MLEFKSLHLSSIYFLFETSSFSVGSSQIIGSVVFSLLFSIINTSLELSFNSILFIDVSIRDWVNPIVDGVQNSLDWTGLIFHSP